MRIAFVQTYPVYHDASSTDTWLKLENRDRWMPGILAQTEHEVELWAGSFKTDSYVTHMDGFGDYTIRLFKTNNRRRKSKKHYSETLIAYARQFDPDLVILKGVDGRIGERLIQDFLRPAGKPYVFVIGGEWYSRYVPGASVVFYETFEQRDRLLGLKKRFFRRRLHPDQLIRLPKSIDTDLFCPNPDIKKKWDIISVGRLIPHYKNYEALAALSKSLRVAVVGGGKAEDRLRQAYPDVTWLGRVGNDRLPDLLNQARMFMHTSLRDYYPRVIAEAAACGLPCLAFNEAIKEDVIPDLCGLRVRRSDFVEPILRLSRNEADISAMGVCAREHARRNLGKYSSRLPMETMMEKLFGKQSA